MSRVVQISSYIPKEASYTLFGFLNDLVPVEWARLYRTKVAEQLYNNKITDGFHLNIGSKKMHESMSYMHLSRFYNKTINLDDEKTMGSINKIFTDFLQKNFFNFILQNTPLVLLPYLKKGYEIRFDSIQKIAFEDRFFEWEQTEDVNTKYNLFIFIAPENLLSNLPGVELIFVNQPTTQEIQSGDLIIIPNKEEFNFLINNNNLFENCFVIRGQVGLYETRFCAADIKISIPVLQEIENGVALYKTAHVSLNKGESMSQVYQKIKNISDKITISLEDFEKKFGSLFE
jgi:sporulation protein YlmC with PRC-barrel domain